MVLDKLSVPWRLTYLDNSRSMTYCDGSRCGWGLFGRFYSIIFLFFLPLSGRRPEIN